MRLLLISFSLLILAGPAAAGSILISEVLADPSGKDDGAVFVEIFGPGLASLDGYVLRARNGSGGSVTHEVSLSGLVIPEDGFLVVADASKGVTSVVEVDLLVEDFDLQNGPESLLLLCGEDVVDALAYGTFRAEDAWYGEGDPIPTGPSGTSLAREFADLDTDDNRVDFMLDAPTPGTGRLHASDPAPSPEPSPAPMPEPSTGLLVLLGGGAAMLVTRRPRSGRVARRTRSRSR